MAKVFVLYYSSHGHIETMAQAVAEGARAVGVEVTVKRVPELVPTVFTAAVRHPRPLLLGSRRGSARYSSAAFSNSP